MNLDALNAVRWLNQLDTFCNVFANANLASTITGQVLQML
jgi:hypothetical protein